MSHSFVNNVVNQFGRNPIRSRVKIVLFSFTKSAYSQFQEGVMDQVVHILWKYVQKKGFTCKNIVAKIVAVELHWILTNQEAFSPRENLYRSKHIFNRKSSDWSSAGKASHYVGFDCLFPRQDFKWNPRLLMLFTMILAKKQSSTVTRLNLY